MTVPIRCCSCGHFMGTVDVPVNMTDISTDTTGTGNIDVCSHALCDTCLRVLYPDIADEVLSMRTSQGN